jgi:Type II secretion system protein C
MRAAVFWLAACAALAMVVAYQLSSGLSLAPTVTAAPPGASALDLAEPPALPLPPDDSAVRQIAARPLFSETRQPYVAPPEPVEEALPEPRRASSTLELAGTYLTETDQAALLQVAGGTPAWLRKGQAIEGWQVEVIAHDRVELRKNGQQQVLQLRDDLAVLKASRPASRQTTRAEEPPRSTDDEPADEDQSSAE